MLKRALLCLALMSGCALHSGGPEEEAPQPNEPAAPQAGAVDPADPQPELALPAEGTPAARAILRTVHRSTLTSLRAARVSEPGASAIAAHHAAVYALGDLRALGVSETDLGWLARAAADAPPADEGCAPTVARSLASELVVTPDEGDARVLSLIRGATTSIDVVMYQLSSYSIRNALADARARGVRVRVILDRKQSRTASLLAELQAKNIEAQASSARFTYTHQKTMVVDGKTLLVFSGNFDRASFGTGRNFGVIVRDPEDVWDVQDLFEADWNERTPDLACTRLVVAPVNARDRIVALIDSAATEVLVEALYASDAGVLDAVSRAKRRGVSVRVLFNDPEFGVGNATDEAQRLAGEGIAVRRSPDLFIHAKLVVVDRSSAFIGSENFSTGGLVRNREVGVIVGQADIDVAAIVTVFERDYAAGAPF